MLRKLFACIGLRPAAASTLAEPPYAPYQSGAANEIYNLLFCDDPAAFKPKAGHRPVAWQVALFSEPVERSSLMALAGEASQEGRVRYLAYAKLRALRVPVPAKVLLGVIVEVPLAAGLDVLAAFSDGGVRYVNETGKLAVFEGAATIQPHVQRLFAAAEPVVARLGPWEQPRRSPPKAGNVRLTFLASDGLYFGEGAMSAMQREAMVGSVIQRATELLQTVVSMATN